MPAQPPPPPRPNQRQHPRYELLASVELHQGEETLILPARNLSLGGIFVGSDGNDLRRFRIGTSVDVLVFDASDESHPALRAGAHVIRHHKGGMALRWNENADTAHAVQLLLESLRPTRADA